MVERGDAPGDAVPAGLSVPHGLAVERTHTMRWPSAEGHGASRSPHLLGRVAAASRPAQRLDPVRFVGDDPVPERTVFLAGRGQHRHEPALMPVDVVHVGPRCQLGVGDVEEVGPVGQRDQPVPRGHMRGVVVGVAVHGPVGDRHRTVGDTVKIHTSCLRSGRCAFEWP